MKVIQLDKVTIQIQYSTTFSQISKLVDDPVYTSNVRCEAFDKMSQLRKLEVSLFLFLKLLCRIVASRLSLRPSRFVCLKKGNEN